MASILASYNSILARRPIATKMLTASGLFFVSDIAAQKIIDRQKPIDWYQVGTTVAFAGGAFAVCGHFWYSHILERAFVGAGWGPALKKVAADQLLWAPVFLMIFYIYSGLTDGLSVNAAFERAKPQYIPTMFANWKIWPFVHCVTFGFIPPEQRILFISFVNLFWNVYLCWMKRQNMQDETALEQVKREL